MGIALFDGLFCMEAFGIYWRYLEANRMTMQSVRIISSLTESCITCAQFQDLARILGQVNTLLIIQSKSNYENR